MFNETYAGKSLNFQEILYPFIFIHNQSDNQHTAKDEVNKAHHTSWQRPYNSPNVFNVTIISRSAIALFPLHHVLVQLAR